MSTSNVLQFVADAHEGDEYVLNIKTGIHKGCYIIRVENGKMQAYFATQIPDNKFDATICINPLTGKEEYAGEFVDGKRIVPPEGDEYVLNIKTGIHKRCYIVRVANGKMQAYYATEIPNNEYDATLCINPLTGKEEYAGEFVDGKRIVA